MTPEKLGTEVEEQEDLSTVCEQGMFGELGISDPTQQEVEK